MVGNPHGAPRRPFLLRLSVTDRCNLRCHSCGQWGDSGYLLDTPNRDLKEREVPLPVYRNFARRVTEAGG